ncbi:rod shape-determining protein MreD [Virgibacillus subterraneus]|uniref:Rod shape-determining protein MreD n=1 Tax=Virgibacillus subterraneus TaxID=621109 RepID=A0A1H9DMI7_9BACI|nr:rod shape-determining protein MreD [Virgibacillus subterraneus]SEQ14641.1 rod shape-determining protein MreD [Virgibacillus subterraneus]
MKRIIIPLILFLFLVLEGVALELLPVSLAKSDLVIVPHWVFVFLLLLTIFYDRENTYFSVLYGLLFGLLIDIVYTGVLGVYMFSYALVIYIIHGLTKMLHANFFVSLLLGMIGLILCEVFINAIYTVVGISDMIWKDYLIYRMAPTVIANIVFLAALYPIMLKKLSSWRNEQLSTNTTF